MGTNTSQTGRRKTASRTPSRCVERLEDRRLLSVDVLTHHNGVANDGQNLAETVLTPATVNPTSFGKQFTTPLDGAIFAQPLYVQSINVSRGSSPGVHSVLFVVTLHDSLYALDADTGAILWQDNFLNPVDPTNLTPTAGVTTVPSTALSSTSLGSELGILSTPAIDLGLGELFLCTNTQEIRGTDRHFVQRIFAVNLTDGSTATAPAVIADTIANSSFFTFTGYQYVSGPIVNGSGNNSTPTTYPDTDGWASAPGGKTTPVIAFNALLQMGRTAITLMGGNAYLGFASHGDNGPYYGWVLGYAESNLALKAAFVTTPTYEGIVGNQTLFTAQGGIWTAGSGFASDGTHLFITTGNGAFNPDPGNFDSQGFPIDHDYADSLLKLAVDPNSGPSNQNGNGWGLKVADYFTPSNALVINQLDLDLGSGGTTLLPDSLLDAAGNPMLVVGGKESRLYLIDRNNLGKFNFNYPLDSSPDPRLYDRVLGEYPSDPINNGDQGIYSTPSYFNGRIYVGFAKSPALVFDADTFASPTSPPGVGYKPTPVQQTSVYGYPGTTFAISADHAANGIAWATNFGTSDLLAYDAGNVTTPIYESNTQTADKFASLVKFVVPTVANGGVYLTTSTGSVLGFGIRKTYLPTNPAFFGAPGSLTATPTANGPHLAWVSHSSLATEFRIERSADDSTWTPIALVESAVTSFDDRTANGTNYFYRVVAVSGANSTAASNVTTPAVLELTGQNAYLKIDADHVHLDVWTNATGTGTPAQKPLLSSFGSIHFTPSLAGDSLTIDASNGNPLPLLGVTFTGAGSPGANTLRIVGTSAGDDTLIRSAGLILFDGSPVNLVNEPATFFKPGTGSDDLTVSNAALTIDASTDGLHTDRFSSISIGPAGLLTIAGPSVHENRAVVQTQSLSIAGTTNAWTGTLDLTGNDLEITTGNLATTQNQLASGYGHGQWTGTGIRTTAAATDSGHLTSLGAILNNGIYGTNGPLGLFDNTNPAASTVLLRFTYAGDANLDGRVDGSDYTLIDHASGTSLTGWINGDFNFDGKVDGSDYTLIDNAFNSQSVSLAAGLTAVPADVIATTAPPPVKTITPAPTTPDLTADRKLRRRPVEEVGL